MILIKDISEIKDIVEKRLRDLYGGANVTDISMKSATKIGDSWSVVMEARIKGISKKFYFSIDLYTGNVFSFNEMQT